MNVGACAGSAIEGGSVVSTALTFRTVVVGGRCPQDDPALGERYPASELGRHATEEVYMGICYHVGRGHQVRFLAASQSERVTWRRLDS